MISRQFYYHLSGIKILHFFYFSFFEHKKSKAAVYGFINAWIFLLNIDENFSLLFLSFYQQKVQWTCLLSFFSFPVPPSCVCAFAISANDFIFIIVMKWEYESWFFLGKVCTEIKITRRMERRGKLCRIDFSYNRKIKKNRWSESVCLGDLGIF